MPVSTGAMYLGSTLVSGGGGGGDQQTFTTSGTFTVPNNVTSILVHVRGGDGGTTSYSSSAGVTYNGASGGATSVGALSAEGGLGGYYKSSSGSAGTYHGGPTNGCSKTAWLDVSPGQELTVTIGSGTGARADIAWGPNLRSQLFTSSGTFTVPAGVTEVEVSVTGGRGTRVNGSHAFNNITGASGGTTSVGAVSAGGGEGGRDWYNSQYYLAWRNPLNGATNSSTVAVTPGQELTVTVGTGANAHAVVTYVDPDASDPGGVPSWMDSWPAGQPFPYDAGTTNTYTVPGTLQQTFTASGTYTPAVGVSTVNVAIIGGGGTGGTLGSFNALCAGGSGGQVVVHRNVPVTGPVTVTIGGTNTASSFGTLSAAGGSVGLNGASGGDDTRSAEAWPTSWGGGTAYQKNGGAGVTINGTTYAGGGGGGNNGATSSGGSGGGGAGVYFLGSEFRGWPGTNGTGGGGGAGGEGGSNPGPFAGGSGKVIVWSEDV